MYGVFQNQPELLPIFQQRDDVYARTAHHEGNMRQTIV